METREIFRLTDLILKRKQQILTHTNRKKCVIILVLEAQDKKGILDKKKRKLNYFVVKFTTH